MNSITVSRNPEVQAQAQALAKSGRRDLELADEYEQQGLGVIAWRLRMLGRSALKQAHDMQEVQP